MGLFVNTFIYCNTVIAVILEMILVNNPYADFADGYLTTDDK